MVVFIELYGPPRVLEVYFAMVGKSENVYIRQLVLVANWVVPVDACTVNILVLARSLILTR